MIKYILAVIFVLALIGGAIRFQSNEESWQLIINKQDALHSVKNGAVRIYKQVNQLISDSDAIETSTLIVED